jgi:magnesium transporter
MMIRTCAIFQDGSVKYDFSLQELKNLNMAWYWVDFHKPTEEETKVLHRFFHFHPLSIEDCMENVQRPKLDFYDTYMFVVLHAIHQQTLEPEELDIFINKHFIVTYHKQAIRDLNNIWHRVKKDPTFQEGPIQILHKIADKIVDDYFPPVYQLEDLLNQVEGNTKNQTINDLMKQLFEIRSDLYKLRRTIIPMRDLLYRIISSERLSRFKEELYFHDIYDHLIKLVEMIDANRELTADIRDSYLSFTSNRMNTIMMTLTVISSVFMPLTFIAGIYGMNFQYMPELEMKYGYFIVLVIMGIIGGGMLYFFYRMGWFRFHKGPKL